MKTKRIEIILATAFYIFGLIVLYSNAMRYLDIQSLYSGIGMATIIYLSFVAFTGFIVPNTFYKNQIELGLMLTAGGFFLAWAGLAGSWWLKNQSETFSDQLLEGPTIGVATAIFSGLILYELIKRLIRYFNTQTNPLVSRILRESLMVLGGVIVIFIMVVNLDADLGAFWITSSLYLYLLYTLCTYWLIPKFEKNKSEVGRIALIAVLVSFFSYIPFGALFMGLINGEFGEFLLTWIGLNIFALPLIYYSFSLQKSRLAEVLDLKIELGNTSAGLSFLRSQINPHFLFNILNTLYGTALQENAEKTSNGIQKLGDMMRFMLHENNQDRILLSREIEYLHNYIDIQLLRTESSPNITVEYAIQENIGPLYIAPMLLIPFVENAFKHGISLQEKSWIKMSLKEVNGVVYFDIHNSIHRKNATDPESQRSGIGLENVRQRLEAIYPNRHDYSVREAAQDFYVHLTIKL